jgi:hypothetical protein
MTAQPDILGNVVLSNGDLAVLAANPYQHNGYSGFDDLQVAILANSTPVTLNQTTGTISFPSVSRATPPQAAPRSPRCRVAAWPSWRGGIPV